MRRSSYLLGEPLSISHDDQILTFQEWLRLNRLSDRTGRRILGSPDGPVITRLSAKRIGISIKNNRAWQSRREQA
jgi:hypothetical protein